MAGKRRLKPGPPPKPRIKRDGVLSGQQQLFVAEYLIDLNATQAAIRAGYVVKGAPQTAYKLMCKVEIIDAIALAMKDRSDRLKISQDRTLLEIAKRAYTGYSRFITVDESGNPKLNLTNCTTDELDCITDALTETVMDGSERVRKVRIKIADNAKYLELLMRHLGMFNDKVTHEFAGLSDADLIARARAAGLIS